MPRGHIDMRFRRLRSPRSGRLHCNTHGQAQLHNCMGYGRTGFCLDFPFEVLSFSDLCSSRQSILFVRTICCIWISKHYDLISANVASGRWAEGRENDDHWTTLRRLVDGRGKCFAVGRPDYGEVMAALESTPCQHSASECGTFKLPWSLQMEERGRGRRSVFRSRNDYETQDDNAENREAEINVDIGEQPALRDHI
jgi:hypothetical protein